MKKTLLILLVVIFHTLCARAHKVWPYPMTFAQSDGTTITVRLHGDDTFSWYTDMNGNILERHGNDFKKLSVDPTTYLARASQATRARAMLREPIATSKTTFPHMGSPRVLVILAEYQDKKFALKNPRASFEQYFNATDGHPRNLGNGENNNYGSVSGGTNAVKVVNPNDANEYFVLQLFEDKGWNQRMAWYKGKDKVVYDPSTKGLLIYHVNYDATLFSLMANDVNNEVGKPRMTVVPADGRLVSSYRIGKKTSGKTISRLDYAKQVNGDIFRVDDERADSTFSQSMDLPNAKWRVSAPDMPVFNITYKDDCVYIDYLKHLTPAGMAERHVDPSLAKMIYTVDGRRMGTSIEALPKGVYIRGGKKFVK